MLNPLRQWVNSTTPISVDPVVTKKLNYENFVTTVKLVPPDHSLHLESIISYYYGGFIKCDPRRFCGIVFRLKCSLGMTTHLVFRSGKMNTVGAKTLEHARFGAQSVRLYISRIPGVYLRNGKLSLCPLDNNTTFMHFTTQLMVVSATLSRRPNLKRILDVAPDLSKWSPDRFPGLRFLVWVRPQNKCTCFADTKKKPKSNNCRCTVTVILFDTGKMNITGCRSFSDVNCAIKLLEMLFEDDQFISNDPLLPSHLRNKARKELIQFAGVRQTRSGKTDTFDVFSLIPPRKKQRDKK